MPDLMLSQLFESLRGFTAGQPIASQWFVVLFAGALPFVESYYGSVIGIVAGVNPIAAILSATIGNIASTTGCAAIAVAFSRRSSRDKKAAVGDTFPETESVGHRIKNPKLRRRFEKYGVPGVCMGSQIILPSQITAATLVRIGAPLRQVIVWQCLSITVWGIGYGSLAILGVKILA